MNHRTRHGGMTAPEGWLVVLRVGIGLYFAKALWSKLAIGTVAGVVPALLVQRRWIEVMPKIVARQAAENPILWYKGFLEQTVIPNAELFAILTAWGEVVAGVGLVLGLCSGMASLVGLSLVINYGLATQHMSPGQFGFHYTLLFVMLVLLGARVGKRWGLDAWIADRWPESVLTRRPWS